MISHVNLMPQSRRRKGDFMSQTSTAEELTGAAISTRFRPLRVWPAVVFLIGMPIFRLLPSLVEDGPMWMWMTAAFGPMVMSLLILIWWIVASRATWQERLI